MVSWRKAVKWKITESKTDEISSTKNPNGVGSNLTISKPTDSTVQSTCHSNSMTGQTRPTNACVDNVYNSLLPNKDGSLLDDDFVHYMAYSMTMDRVFKELSYGFVKQYSEDLNQAKFSIKQQHLKNQGSRQRESVAAERDLRARSKNKRRKKTSKEHELTKIEFKNTGCKLTANKRADVQCNTIDFEIDEKFSTLSLDHSSSDRSSFTKFVQFNEDCEISENGLYIEFPKACKAKTYIKLLFRHKSLIKDVDSNFKPNKIDREFSENHYELSDLDWTHLQQLALNLKSSLDGIL